MMVSINLAAFTLSMDGVHQLVVWPSIVLWQKAHSDHIVVSQTQNWQFTRLLAVPLTQNYGV